MQRSILFDLKDEIVPPTNETVAQVFARLSAYRDSMDGPQVSTQPCLTCVSCCLMSVLHWNTLPKVLLDCIGAARQALSSLAGMFSKHAVCGSVLIVYHAVGFAYWEQTKERNRRRRFLRVV